MTTAAIISLGLLVVVIAFTAFAVSQRADGPAVFGGILAVVLLLTTGIAGWLAIAPDYRLHKATIEKRILVEQARAEADASVEQARGEIERAKGTAEANAIVADSITEPYLRYLYINNLSKTKNQIVYLPTEAGLPILEAQRGAKSE